MPIPLIEKAGIVTSYTGLHRRDYCFAPVASTADLILAASPVILALDTEQTAIMKQFVIFKYLPIRNTIAMTITDQ